MIRALVEMADELRIHPVFVPVVLAALFTEIVLAASSIARLLEDRNR